MLEVGSFEAKNRLPELLRYVEETGDEVIITRRGKQVGKLVSAAPRKKDMRKAIEGMRKFRAEGHTLDLPEGMTLRDYIHEGHKY